MLYDKRWGRTKTKPVDEVGKLLLRAADIIDERGHAKGTLEAEDGSVCALGALLVADEQAHSKTYKAARLRLMARVGQYVSVWNNERDRTPTEVTQAMRAAAFASNK